MQFDRKISGYKCKSCDGYYIGIDHIISSCDTCNETPDEEFKLKYNECFSYPLTISPDQRMRILNVLGASPFHIDRTVVIDDALIQLPNTPEYNENAIQLYKLKYEVTKSYYPEYCPQYGMLFMQQGVFQ